MKTLDPRIRDEHIARYGATDDVGAYLRTLGGLLSYVVPDASYRAQNHHMLAKSVWPQYANLRIHPWNRLRVSYALHTALTDIQSWFEERLRGAACLMKGQSTEDFYETARKNGKIQGRKNVTSGHLAKIAHLGGKKHVESGHLARLRTPEHQRNAGKLGGKIQGKRNAESDQWVRIQRMGAKVANCSRWNISRGKPCVCGQHTALAEGAQQ